MPEGGFSLDQISYINAFKPMQSDELYSRKRVIGKSSQETREEASDAQMLENIEKDSTSKPASASLAKLFLSLLVAMAYGLQTRPDLAIYINALQRYAQAPMIIHVKRLNAVVRWAQKHPVK